MNNYINLSKKGASLLFESDDIQNILLKTQGELSNITNDEYAVIIGSAAFHEIDGVFDNDGLERAQIVLYNLYRNTKNRVGVYSKSFFGGDDGLSDKDTVVEGWDECLKNNPELMILIDQEPQRYTKTFKKICSYIKNTGKGQIRVTTTQVRESLKEKFPDGKIHYFSLGDYTKVRFELDNGTREAWCSFNHEDFNRDLWHILSEGVRYSTEFVIDDSKLS